MMRTLIIVFFGSLLLGQLGAIHLSEGITVYAHDSILLLLIITVFFRRGMIGKLPRLILFRPILIFIFAASVSLLVNVGSYDGWIIRAGSLYLLRWSVYTFLYAIVVFEILPWSLWLWGLAGLGTILAVLGLIQFVWYPDLRNLWYLGWDPHYYRVFATLLDPNYVGILLVLTLFVLSYMLVRYARWRAWITVVMGMVGIALILTFSRSSYLALLAGLCTAVILVKQWRKKGLFLVLLFLLFIVYIPKPGGDTLSLDRYDSTVSRLQNWQQTVMEITKRPVFGFGFNVLPFLSRSGIDSSFLFVGVTAGIVGLVGYLWLIFALAGLALRSRDRQFKILILSSMSALFVHSLFVNSLFYPWVMIWIWVLAGVAEKYYLE